MKVLIVLVVLLAVVSCWDDNQYINDPNIIYSINAANQNTFQAGRNKIFDGVTFGDAAKRFLGAKPRGGKYPVKHFVPKDVPEHWDWREQGNCVHKIRDQANCGSCYAFGASEAVSDKFCIATKGQIDEVMSPQWIVSCDKQELGCSGGYPTRVWDFMSKTGIVTDKCFPYTSGGGSVEACPTKCKDGSALKMHKIHNVSSVFTAPNFMIELLEGPFEVCFAVYQDFFSYKSGVYSHKSGGLAGYHAVKIIGWGTDAASKLPYWIIANSWGESWGQKGFFWMKKGTDECQMESGVGGQLPAVTGTPILE